MLIALMPAIHHAGDIGIDHGVKNFVIKNAIKYVVIKLETNSDRIIILDLKSVLMILDLPF